MDPTADELAGSITQETPGGSIELANYQGQGEDNNTITITWHLTRTVDNPCQQPGSIIAAQTQSLGETVGIVGTPFRLHYQSDRMPGRTAASANTQVQHLGGWSLNVHHAYAHLGRMLFLGDGGRRSQVGPTAPQLPPGPGLPSEVGLAGLPGFGGLPDLPTAPEPPAQEIVIPSVDGSEVYVFDGTGQHLRTLEALTGALRYQFTYDSTGRLTAITGGDGNVTTIERDADGHPTAIVGPYGQRTTLTLDASGYLATITNPAGEVVQLTYTSDGLLTSLTDPRGNVHRFSYDTLGRLLRDEDPAGGITTLARTDTADGSAVTLSTALGRTTTYQVENPPTGGQRLVNALPSGLRTESEEGSDGTRMLRLPDGTVTMLTLGPDPRWGMQSPLPQRQTTTTPGGLVSTITTGRTVDLADPNNPLSLNTQTDTFSINGRTYTGTYVAATRTFTGTTPQGRQVSSILDTQGRVVQVQIAGLLPTSYGYDGRGQLSTTTQGAGSDAHRFTLTYNSDGYLATITDPLGHTASFGYDAAGRVITETLPDGRVIGSAYDAHGNLTAITPAGQPAHTFAYTPVDLQSAYTPPAVGAGTNQTLYTYNVDRQLTQITLPDGQIVDLGYDSAGRLNALTIPRGTLHYAYDPTTGNLVTISAPDGIGLAYTYDGALLIGETWSGPVAGTTSYTYDHDFRITTSSINGSNTITFQYDQDILLTQAGALTLSRNAQNGLLTGSTLDDVTDTWSYNSFNEPINYSAAYNGTSLYNVQYTHDKLGRITQKTETIGGVTDIYSYSYDLAGRLAEVTKNGTTIASYTYDSSDNRVSFTGPGGTLTGSYDNQDRLTQYGSTVYSYTANGELQSKTVGGQTTTYQYDALGNLMAVTLPNGRQITYLVDGQNRRIGKQVNGPLVQGFLYQDDLRPIAELDGSNTVVSRFVYASRDNVPDYLIKGSTTYRIIADHLGSPRLVIDVGTGQIVQRMDYDVFGNVTTDTNPGFQPFGFAGGLYDRDTNLVRFGARDYDAETGRWTAKDPILFGGSQANLYAYVGNDPLNLIDPAGAWSFEANFYAGIGGGVTFTYIPGKGLSGGFELGVGAGVSYEFDPDAEPFQGDPWWDSKATLFAQAQGKLGPVRGTVKLESNELQSCPGEFGAPEFSSKVCVGPFCYGSKGTTLRYNPQTGAEEQFFFREKGRSLQGKAGVKVIFPIFGR
ncbi:MAG: RHS repeat-associated core domain-containing protein [Deinococcus sp.]|nr:RHS repeat-associated core domain-containing protein [Deinococcus sp.]